MTCHRCWQHSKQHDEELSIRYLKKSGWEYALVSLYGIGAVGCIGSMSAIKVQALRVGLAGTPKLAVGLVYALASEILGGISKPVDRLMETPVEST